MEDDQNVELLNRNYHPLVPGHHLQIICLCLLDFGKEDQLVS